MTGREYNRKRNSCKGRRCIVCGYKNTSDCPRVALGVEDFPARSFAELTREEKQRLTEVRK